MKDIYRSYIGFSILALALILMFLLLAFNILGLSISINIVSYASSSGQWVMLARDYRHSAYISTVEIVGDISSPGYKWIFKFGLGDGQYSFNSNPLIVDLDSDGRGEVISVDASGRLVFINGVDGSLLGYLNVNASFFSTPSFYDLDGDGYPEAVIGGRDGYLRAVDIDPNSFVASVLWEIGGLDISIDSSPIVTDIDSDGNPDVFIETRFGLYRVDGYDGSIIWWYREHRLSFVNSPVLCNDVNGDGIDDILYVSAKGYVAVIDSVTGNKVWSIDLSNMVDMDKKYIIHSPVICDFDGDGVDEVALNIGREVFDWIPGTSTGETSTGMKVAKRGVEGFVIFVNIDDGSISGWATPSGGDQFFLWFSQPSMSSGDFDGDGLDELVIGSGDGWIYLVEYINGNYDYSKLAQVDNYWPNIVDIDAVISSTSLLTVDIDGDSDMEIVCIGTSSSGGILSYTIYAISPLNGNIEWTFEIKYQDLGIGGIDRAKFSWPSISAGDIDGDGFVEVVVNAFQCIASIE